MNHIRLPNETQFHETKFNITDIFTTLLPHTESTILKQSTENTPTNSYVILGKNL
jgi:hypothetical protein